MAAGKDANGDNNQRVTNALLKKDIEHLTDMLREYQKDNRACDDDHEARIRALEGNQREILTIIRDLDRRVKTWDFGNSIAAGIAMVLAAVGIQK